MIRDAVGDKRSFRPADQFRRDIVADGQDEHENGASADPRHRVREINLPEREPWMCAERDRRAHVAFGNGLHHAE